MARAVLTEVVVFPERLFHGDGLVRRWNTRLTQELKSAVKAKAPPRRSAARWVGRRGTGALNRSITGRTTSPGRVQAQSTVAVGVYYAKWVLGGTASQGRRYIYSSSGWLFKPMVDAQARLSRKGGRVNEDFAEMGFYMKLPLSNVGGSRVYFLRVHGQRANNFLIDGYNEIARFHRALRPMANKYKF